MDPVDESTWRQGTCPVGTYGSNGAGLSDMIGNVSEWTSTCREGDCGHRVLRGDSWFLITTGGLGAGWAPAGNRSNDWGFRVSRVLDSAAGR